MLNLSNPLIKISHLRLIVAIAEFGRISLAADTLLITQPAASRLLAELEKILGVKLCDRHAKGMELTLYGRSFARRAKTILLEMREITRDIDELKAGKGGVARVGAVTGAAVGYVVQAIQQIKAASPGTDVHVHVASSVELVQDLLAGSLDFILARLPEAMNPDQFDAYRVKTEKIELMVRKEHPLSTAQAVSLHDLVHYEWVMQSRGNPIRQIIDTAFFNSGAAVPYNVTNSTSLLVTIAILANSSAISPVAREVSDLLSGDAIAAKFTVLSLQDGIRLELDPYNLMTVRGRRLSPTASHLRELVQLSLERRAQ